MNAYLNFMIVFTAGIVLGIFYFGMLWVTVRLLLEARRPLLLVFSSFLIRLSVVLIGFYLVIDGDWQRLLVCAGGFLIVRTLMVRRVRKDGSRKRQEVY